MSSSLKGRLILADPTLIEATFAQSVILLTEHDEEMGAHGFILNRPIGKKVGELLSDEAFSTIADVPVFIGGPVSTEHLTFSSLGWSPLEDKLVFSTHLSAKEAVQHHLEGFDIRAFVGYSGWSGGQLEEELERNSWITHDAEEQILEIDRLTTLWKRMLREMSPWHKLVADQPDDLSLN